MTSNNEKLRALFLSALMVVSVFGAAVAFTGGAAAAPAAVDNVFDDVDREVSNGDTVYQGQVIAVGVSGFSDDAEVRRVTGDNSQTVGTLVATPTTNGSYAKIDTSNYESGAQYVVTNNSTGDPINNTAGDVKFELVVQDLSVSFDDEDVGDTGSAAETTVEIDSQIRNEYAVMVTAEGLDSDDLVSIFTDETRASATWVNDTGADYDNRSLLYNIKGDSGNYTVNTEDDELYLMDAEGEHDISFKDIDADDYEFEFEVVDTTASDTAAVTVEDIGAGSLNLDPSSVDVAQGDVAEITVTFSDAADTGSLLIGDADDDGYQANVSLEDDGDGQVTVYFNTYVAGNNTSATGGAPNSSIVWPDTADEDDVADLQNGGDDAQILSNILDTGNYELAVSADGISETADSPDNIGSMYIQERSTEALNVWTASSSNADSWESVGDVTTAVDNDELTETSTVARDDALVMEVGASGLQGIVENDTAIDSDGVADGFIDAMSADSNENETFSMLLEQQDPGANTDANEFDLADLETSNATAYYNGATDSYYLVVDATSSVLNVAGGDDTLADGDSFELTLDVKDQRLLGYSDSDYDSDGSDVYDSVSAEFTLEDADASFDVEEVDGDDYVVVNVAEGQTISGTTNIAPGTEVTIRATGEDEARFVKSQTGVVVQADGTFSADFDFSDRAVDEEFTAKVSQGALGGSGVTADGIIVEAVEETTTTEEVTTTEETTTEETTTEETTTEETTTEETTTEETTTTSTQTPGFGIAVAMLALIGAALVALRRRN